MAGKALLLTSLMKGVDKIPDSVWERIPGHGTPKEERERRERESRRESQRQRRRRNSSSSGSSRRDDGYDYRQEARSGNYYPRDDKPRAGSVSSAAGYNDFDPYATPHRSTTHTARPRVGFVNGAAVGGTAAAAAGYSPRNSVVSATPDLSNQQQLQQYSDPAADDHIEQSDEERRARDRGGPSESDQMSYNDYSRRHQDYHPENYVPHDQYYDEAGSGRDTGYSSSGRQYDEREGDYRRNSYDDDYDHRHSEHGSRRSKSHSNRSPSRSRSRFGDMKKNFDRSERGMTTGAIGAIAGGLVGSEVGKGVIPTIAGVVLGGLAANAWEARDAKQNGRNRDRRGDRRTRSAGGERERDKYSSRRSRDTEYAEDRGGRYDDRYDDDGYDGNGRDTRNRSLSRHGDDGDSYDGSRRRHRASRRREEEREEEAAPLKWNNTLET